MRQGVVGLLLLGYFVLFGAPIFAEEMTAPATMSAQPAVIDYVLPYPGLLPDNPLYFLKATRDRVVSFFIKEPTKKASFNLLQADKRVQAAVLLSKKEDRKLPVVVSTFSKAENYFEEAIQNVKTAKSQKKDLAGLNGKMQTAAKKYKEILLSLENRLSPEKEAYKILLKRIDSQILEAEKL